MVSLLLLLTLLVPRGLDLYIPVPEGNPVSAEKVAIGRRLFNDRRLSRDNTVSCASCHLPARAFTDGRARAVGVFGRTGHRSAPTLINRGYGRAFSWDGRIATLEEQVLQPISNPDEMGLTLNEASARVGLSVGEISRALATYVRSLLAGDSPFDRYVTGDRAALSPEQHRGLAIFRGAGNCSACHVGPTLSDEQFHNTGIAWREASGEDRGTGRFLDNGRFEVTRDPAETGAFKTPTLREIGQTAPYMHDGSLATLDEVIDFYNRGGRPNPQIDAELHPLNLGVDDKRALRAFLQALSGQVNR